VSAGGSGNGSGEEKMAPILSRLDEEEFARSPRKKAAQKRSVGSPIGKLNVPV